MPERDQQPAICPYCGVKTTDPDRCRACGGRLDPLSQQATQNGMGPWYIRRPDQPFLPGCSYETLRGMVERRQITSETVVRGPSTRQFWTRATRVPGLAHLLGCCHACGRDVETAAYACRGCGAVFNVDADRQHLGVSPVRPLPGSVSAARVASAALGSSRSEKSSS